MLYLCVIFVIAERPNDDSDSIRVVPLSVSSQDATYYPAIVYAYKTIETEVTFARGASSEFQSAPLAVAPCIGRRPQDGSCVDVNKELPCRHQQSGRAERSREFDPCSPFAVCSFSFLSSQSGCRESGGGVSKCVVRGLRKVDRRRFVSVSQQLAPRKRRLRGKIIFWPDNFTLWYFWNLTRSLDYFHSKACLRAGSNSGDGTLLLEFVIRDNFPTSP
jgi:hypothetical protein